MQCSISFINKKTIRPSLKSYKIYGKATWDDEFLASICEYGILEPLIIDQNNRLLSGHRRLNVALMLDNITDVPCVIRNVASEHEANIIIVDSNRQRKKNTSMRLREAETLDAAVTELSKSRHKEAARKPRISKKSQEETKPSKNKLSQKSDNLFLSQGEEKPSDPHCNTTVSIVAATVGMSATTLSCAKEIEIKRPDLMEKIDNGDMKIGAAYAKMKKDEKPASPPKPKPHGGTCRNCGHALECPAG